jgi:hypothetical protein
MGTKALTKRMIKELGEAIAKTGSINIARGHIKLPRSTYYYWKKMAEEVEESNPDRVNLTKNEELLLEFLDTIDFSKAEAGVKLSNAAFKAAMNGDGRIAIRLLESLFPDDYTPFARKESTIKVDTDSESNSGIALIPTANLGTNLEEMLKTQQQNVQNLAKSKTKELQNGED